MSKKINNQSGQIIIVLLLIVVVVLAIGLSVVGRSNTEVLTASKIENSARAFSAAEAGIEHAISVTLTGSTTISLTNSSTANVGGTGYPSLTVPNIEQKNIGGTDPNNPTYAFAQFWFADPNSLAWNNAGVNDKFYLYFGNNNPGYTSTIDNRPAVEVHVIYAVISGGVTSYKDAKYYFDSVLNGRSTSTPLGAGNVAGCGASSLVITTNFSDQPGVADRNFYCRVTVGPSPLWKNSGSDYPILIRVRVLYSKDAQPVAIGPTDGSLLPKQIYVYTSSGISGSSQRTVQVTRDTDVMPYLFDFALFSDNGASKSP